MNLGSTSKRNEATYAIEFARERERGRKSGAERHIVVVHSSSQLYYSFNK